MTDKLTKLVRYFTLSHDERITERLRREKLEAIRRYCKDRSLDFYLEELTKLPYFAKEVNGFIKRKARRDLPREQLEDRLKLMDLSKWVEIGGVLGYDGQMFQMSYSPPDSTLIQVERRFPNGRTISSSTPMRRVCSEDLNRAQGVIDWHTHPCGFGEVSEGDVDYIKEFIEKLGKDKQVYFIVYMPAKNQAVWYQAKKAQPK